MIRIAAKASAAVLLNIAGIVSAQCAFSCDALNTPYGHPPPIGGVDPHDATYQGQYFQACPCSPDEVYYVSIAYTGIDNQVTSATTSTTLGQANSMYYVTVGFPDAINTDFLVNSPVTIGYGGSNFQGQPSFFYGSTSYTYTPVTSNFYVESTSTVTVTTPTTTTNTVTSTNTGTTSISQQTSTVPCTTGTATVTASGQTSFVTKTVTRQRVTETHPRVIIKTKHASCVSSSGGDSNVRGERGPVRRVAGPAYSVETPWFSQNFGSPQSTTYTTGVTFVVVTDTTTVTTDQTVYESTTVTETPTPLTTTVCSNVAATTTTTPSPVTSTITKKLPGKTTIVTSTYYSTSTIYNQNPPPVCTGGSEKLSSFHKVGGALLKKPAGNRKHA